MKTGLVVALAAGVALGAAVVLVYQDRTASGAGPAGPDTAAEPRAGFASSASAAAGSGRESAGRQPGTTTPALEPLPQAGDDSSTPSTPPGPGDLPPAAGRSSPAVPAVPLPPDVNPRDVYVDPATGMVVLQQLPDATGSSEAPATALPPGVYPRDVEVDPRTGATAVKSLPGGGS